MPVYRFSFPADAAGLTCTVRNARTGATVQTATVGNVRNDVGDIDVELTLTEGDYIGSVKPAEGFGITSRWQSAGILDVVDSIEAGGGGSLDPAADQTITGAWEFDPPVVGTLDENGNSDAAETTSVTIKPKAVGTAAINIIKYDDTPLDPSGYGVSHIDSDGGGGFAGGAITWGERGEMVIDNAGGGPPPFNVKIDSVSMFAIGAGPAMFTASATAEQIGWEHYLYTDATADAIAIYDPVDGSTKLFRVTPTGAVHAAGGVVLKSPNGTAYRLVVANDGTLSTEAV